MATRTSRATSGRSRPIALLGGREGKKREREESVERPRRKGYKGQRAKEKATTTAERIYVPLNSVASSIEDEIKIRCKRTEGQ